MDLAVYVIRVKIPSDTPQEKVNEMAREIASREDLLLYFVRAAEKMAGADVEAGIGGDRAVVVPIPPWMEE